MTWLEQGTFKKMMMMYALYLRNTLSWILIVQTHWNNSARVDMSLHLDTLTGFRAIQFFHSLLNAAYLAEKLQFPIL
jgi:hypothetical protein